jgi:hypothetical protein
MILSFRFLISIVADNECDQPVSDAPRVVLVYAPVAVGASRCERGEGGASEEAFTAVS